MHVLAQAAVEAGSQPFRFTISAWWVQGLQTLVIPIIIGLLIKAKASPWLKSLVNIVLVSVATLITANVNDTGAAVISKETGMVWIFGLAISVMSYLGIYQNLPTPGDLPNGINNLLAPKFGLGKEKPTYVETEQKAA